MGQGISTLNSGQGVGLVGVAMMPKRKAGLLLLSVQLPYCWQLPSSWHMLYFVMQGFADWCNV
jgi:hypothetical protein